MTEPQATTPPGPISSPVSGTAPAGRGGPVTGPYASLGARFGAYVIDRALLSALVAPAVALFYVAIDDGDPSGRELFFAGVPTVLTLVLVIVQWVNLARKGQTVGAWAVGLSVLRAENGAPPGFGKALVRSIVLALTQSVAVVVLVSMFLSRHHPRRQAWHDRAVGVVVVKGTALSIAEDADRAARQAPIPFAGPQVMLDSTAPPVGLPDLTASAPAAAAPAGPAAPSGPMPLPPAPAAPPAAPPAAAPPAAAPPAAAPSGAAPSGPPSTPPQTPPRPSGSLPPLPPPPAAEPAAEPEAPSEPLAPEPVAAEPAAATPPAGPEASSRLITAVPGFPSTPQPTPEPESEPTPAPGPAAPRHAGPARESEPDQGPDPVGDPQLDDVRSVDDVDDVDDVGSVDGVDGVGSVDDVDGVGSVDDVDGATRVGQRRAARPTWVLVGENGQRIAVRSRVVVGRDPDTGQHTGALPAAIADPDRSVSKTHAVLIVTDGELRVDDLGSTNGTHVLSHGVESAVQPGTPLEVQVGDTVWFGDRAFVAEHGG